MDKIYIKSSIIPHILGWILYAGYVYFLNFLTEKNVNVVTVVIYIIPFIALFYMFLYFLRKYRFNKIRGASAIIVSFITFTIIAYLLVVYVVPKFGVNIVRNNFSIQEFLQEIIRYFIQFLVYAILFFIVEELLKKERKVSELEKEKHRLEIEKIISQKEKFQYQYAFLRAQINPHFLYNTLNVLYSQALSLSEDMADNIMKVSDLMRYSLDNVEMENNKIPVQKEIEHLDILLSIYDMRFSRTIYIEKNIKGDWNHHYVAPLSFITIVENAFKYGDLLDSKYPMVINIDFQQDYYTFLCKNKKKKTFTNTISHNIGLSNLKQRLNFSFENKWAINIEDNENFYTLELKINK